MNITEPPNHHKPPNAAPANHAELATARERYRCLFILDITKGIGLPDMSRQLIESGASIEAVTALRQANLMDLARVATASPPAMCTKQEDREVSDARS